MNTTAMCAGAWRAKRHKIYVEIRGAVTLIARVAMAERNRACPEGGRILRGRSKTMPDGEAGGELFAIERST